jgi:hypothetical protein
MSISNSESRTADASPAKEHSTALRAGSIGVMGILFFVLSAQAPLTGNRRCFPLGRRAWQRCRRPGRLPDCRRRYCHLRRGICGDEPQDPGQRCLLRLCHGGVWPEGGSRCGLVGTAGLQHGAGSDVRALWGSVFRAAGFRWRQRPLVGAGPGHDGGSAGTGLAQHRTRRQGPGPAGGARSGHPADVRLHGAL